MGRRTSDDDEFGFSPRFAEAMGRTIKVLRTDQALGRRELAGRARISYSYLTEIENGNKPPSSTVLRDIATALGLPMSSLIEAAEIRMESQQETSVPVTSAEGWALEFGVDRRTGMQAPRDQDAMQASREALLSYRDVLEPQEQDVLPVPSRDELASPPPETRLAPSRGVLASQTPKAYRQLNLPHLASRGSSRDPRTVLIELERLLRAMGPEDVERLLDYARRLAR